MRSTFLLASLCIFMCADIAFATCIVSKYERGYGDRIQCSNVSLNAVFNQTSAQIVAITIIHSNLINIPQRAFVRYAGSLSSLNIQRCKIMNIHQDAFGEMIYLKKLSLSNNNITEVKEAWFKDTAWLEHLDLSYNLIEKIEPMVFRNLKNLKLLDVRENRLTCLSSTAVEFMGALTKLRFSGNRLSLQCRGKLTLWLRDHGVDYKSDQSGKESWLDSLLWLCAIGDPNVAASEVLMRECVILNLFNQLRNSLISAESYPLTIPEECSRARDSLTNCLASQARATSTLTNGNVIQSLLLNLQAAKSAV